MPYGYYQFLRLVVTGYAVFVSWLYFRSGPSQWGWVFGTVALLYNPMFPIAMSKEFHALVNLSVAGLVLFEFNRLRGVERQPSSMTECAEVLPEFEVSKSAGHLKSSTGGWLRVVFPPFLALMVAVGVVAAIANFKAREPAGPVQEVPTSSALSDFKGSDANATAASADFNSEPSAAAGNMNSAVAPTLGQFTDKVDGAVNDFARILKKDGMSGAETYSRNCQQAALRTTDILETDYCVAFDMAAAAMDHQVASSSGFPANEYFKSRALSLDGDYARFTQATPNRTEIIWQEVNSALPSSMQAMDP